MIYSVFVGILYLSVNVEKPAARSDNPCLAVEEVWRTLPMFFAKELPDTFTSVAPLRAALTEILNKLPDTFFKTPSRACVLGRFLWLGFPLCY